MSVVGNTLINTIDGKKAIKEIINTKPYLYSTDNLGRFFIRHAQLIYSKGIKRVVRVWFGDGQYTDCSLDHKFVMADGYFKESNELQIGDPLMIFNYNQHFPSFTKIYNIENLKSEQEVFTVVMSEAYNNYCANDLFNG